MNLVHPDESLVPLLLRMAAADFHYHLFTNNFVPDRDTVLGDLTEQGGGTGYAVVTVLDSDFTLTGVVGHQGSITAPDIAFSPTAGNTFTVYGYYVTDTADALLLAVARFDGAPQVATNPASVVITPKLGDLSRYNA